MLCSGRPPSGTPCFILLMAPRQAPAVFHATQRRRQGPRRWCARAAAWGPRPHRQRACRPWPALIPLCLKGPRPLPEPPLMASTEGSAPRALRLQQSPRPVPTQQHSNAARVVLANQREPPPPAAHMLLAHCSAAPPRAHAWRATCLGPAPPSVSLLVCAAPACCHSGGPQGACLACRVFCPPPRRTVQPHRHSAAPPRRPLRVCACVRWFAVYPASFLARPGLRDALSAARVNAVDQRAHAQLRGSCRGLAPKWRDRAHARAQRRPAPAHLPPAARTFCRRPPPAACT